MQSLQWGRTLSSAESEPAEIHSSSKSPASMGPHSFKCGKACRLPIIQAASNCFNGAALFQVRKAGYTLPPNALKKIASMGPHSFKCGKPFLLGFLFIMQTCFNGAALFQVRKENRMLILCQLGLSFNGAALFQVRKAACSSIHWRSLVGASMGPHSFKCGKQRFGSSEERRIARLQWGRTLSSAESRGCGA